jgi:hypothetical protein
LKFLSCTYLSDLPDLPIEVNHRSLLDELREDRRRNRWKDKRRHKMEEKIEGWMDGWMDGEINRRRVVGIDAFVE